MNAIAQKPSCWAFSEKKTTPATTTTKNYHTKNYNADFINICAHKDFLIYWCVRVLWSSIWIAIDWNRLVKHLNNIAIIGATFDSMMLVSVSRISKVCNDQEFQWKQRKVFNGWSSCTRNQCINITRRTFYNWMPKKKNTRETENKIHTISFAHWTFYATCVIKFMRTHWT